MHRRALPLIIIVLALTACEGGSAAVPFQATTGALTASAPVSTSAATVTPPPPTLTDLPDYYPTRTPTAEPPSAWDTPIKLRPLTANTSQPFSQATTLKTWTPAPYRGFDYALPVSLDDTANAGVTWHLTPDEQSLLQNNGFFVMHSQEESFDAIERSVKDKGQAYFVSADSALHSFHITFDYMLKGLEREVFRPKMIALVDATQQEVLSGLDAAKGSRIEQDTLLAAAYLGVAQKLLDPNATIDPRIEAMVTPQVEQVMAQGGVQASLLIPEFSDDYGAYKPVGHYAGDPDLESYFRGMSWLGRVHFKLDKPSGDPATDAKRSRVPLIITLAMRRAEVSGGVTAAVDWARLHETLTFVIGPSDDPGPAQYATIMDQIYGTSPRPADLVDDARWVEFQKAAFGDLPSPRINSTFLAFIAQLPSDKGWRFMGQRFTLDGHIFQELMFDAVQPAPGDKRRDLPTGPDVMAVLGSPVALAAVHEQGMDNYPNYADQVAKLKTAAQSQPDYQWLGRFYDSWLYAFLPLIGPKDGSYPTVMRGEAWSYREMNAALGSWAELKRDTVLYTKMPEGLGGGGCGTPTAAPPIWVEANPDVFYRMSYAASGLLAGLDGRGLLRPAIEVHYTADSDPGLMFAASGMRRLAENLGFLGDVAARELAGEALTDDEAEQLNHVCLTCFDIPNPEPVPVIAAVAGANNPDGETGVLEAATGYVDRAYVIVPLGGRLMVAQGGVYSYYEIVQPRTDRLTDQQWREKLKADTPPQPVWTAHFTRSGGEITNPMVFKIGGIYTLTPEGDRLNLRKEPSTSGEVILVFEARQHNYLEIVDGPVEADGARWWKVKDTCYDGFEGWVQENPDWYNWSWAW